jgi:hypothetical protein
MDIHDLQLEASTVKELESMAEYVAKQIILKRARPIVKSTSLTSASCVSQDG